MVRKEPCTQCKGNRRIQVPKADKDTWVKCPSCRGQGFKVRLTR